MIVGVWLALAMTGAGTENGRACRFRPPLSDAEASRLVLQTPSALRLHGHGLYVLPSAAPATSKAKFSGALTSKTPGDGALDNGLVGYFAVDRRSGAVTSLADFTPVRSRALAAARATLCRARSR